MEEYISYTEHKGEFNRIALKSFIMGILWTLGCTFSLLAGGYIQ